MAERVSRKSLRLRADAATIASAYTYQWAKEPKIEQRLYGCTARWDAKTQRCKGDWVPLQAQ